MHSRRSFLGTVSLPAAAAAAGISFRPTELRADAIDIAANLATHPGGPMDVVDDENFWFEVQGAFTVDRTLVNLAPPMATRILTDGSEEEVTLEMIVRGDR